MKPLTFSATQVGRRRPTRALGSGKVASIEIHDSVPRGHEVAHEFLSTRLAVHAKIVAFLGFID
jgi:hypothetical protein